ncbi:MAG TPA: DUF885 domain-containing protein [Chthoniobacterales bacterium]
MTHSIRMGLLAAVGCFAIAGYAGGTAGWVQKSNQAAKPLLEYITKYTPENGSSIGIDQADESVVDLKPNLYARSKEDGERIVQQLQVKEASESDPNVRRDLDILITAQKNSLETAKLNHELMLPFYDVGEMVFQGLQTLLDPRNSADRQARAIVRLNRYAGQETGFEPITELAKVRTEEMLGNAKLIRPYVAEVNDAINNTRTYLDGIAELFRTAKLTGWEQAHAALTRQLLDYKDWLQKQILPQARPTNPLPEAIYADNLKNNGVLIDPHTLMERARFEFIEIQDEMRTLAKVIAQQEKLGSSDYREVIRSLKHRTVPPDKLLSFYQDRLAQIEKLVEENNIVSLPKRPTLIRLGSAAETAEEPAPHMNPPRLIDNHGEYGEFVIPNGKDGLDEDFINEGESWTLTAHEARPGHDLQFTSMVDNGVSMARSIFADNSANVEGWAVYMEAVMEPYEPLDGQLFSLDDRLLRIARAFLDPMLNLGLMKPEEAKAFLVNEVALSESDAKEEVERYTYRAPGQAAAYFYGYMTLRELRERTKLTLGAKFDEKAYHDFILSQGLLPLNLMAEAIQKEFVPRYSSEPLSESSHSSGNSVGH